MIYSIRKSVRENQQKKGEVPEPAKTQTSWEKQLEEMLTGKRREVEPVPPVQERIKKKPVVVSMPETYVSEAEQYRRMKEVEAKEHQINEAYSIETDPFTLAEHVMNMETDTPQKEEESDYSLAQKIRNGDYDMKEAVVLSEILRPRTY